MTHFVGLIQSCGKWYNATGEVMMVAVILIITELAMTNRLPYYPNIRG